MGEKDHLKIKIGNRLIGSGEPAYLIAEMSANHAGSIERAKEIIHAPKKAVRTVSRFRHIRRIP